MRKRRDILGLFIVGCTFVFAGCCRQPAIKVSIKLTEDGSPLCIYSYYLDKDGRECLHGEKVVWDYVLKFKSIEKYHEGKPEYFEHGPIVDVPEMADKNRVPKNRVPD